MKQYFTILSQERLVSPSLLPALLLATGLSLLLLSCSGKSNSGKSSSSADIPTEYCDELVKLAEDGNVEAQSNLARLYYIGEGVAQSYLKAYKWLLKAAEQGNAESQLHLGFLYDHGLDVTQSYTEAYKWFRKAAEQGSATAQYNLGTYYYCGRGVTQSYTEAYKWFRKAAEQ
uniref:tetratricopeptide repeat protein n=1 Tax=Porphyromonas uenonis TaxID=281920 RepID=UPI0026ED73D6